MEACPECHSKRIRTFSIFNEKKDRWEWVKGCNDCDWESVDKVESDLHPECYTRGETSPAMICCGDVRVYE